MTSRYDTRAKSTAVGAGPSMRIASPPAGPSPERIEILQLLTRLAVVADSPRARTFEVDIWASEDGVSHYGSVAYLREEPRAWVRFTSWNLRSQRAVETMLLANLRMMIGGGQ